MSHYERLDHLMDGMEFDAWSHTGPGEERSRSLPIPIGRRVLWAVYNPKTFQKKYQVTESRALLIVDDVWRRVTPATGGASVEDGTVTSSVLDYNLEAPQAGEGIRVDMLSEQFIAPIDHPQRLKATFRFDQEGMLMKTHENIHGVYEAYQKHYDTFMTMLEIFHTAAKS
jgi:hypothetical protein